jgi:carboxyl-terminal processing protease
MTFHRTRGFVASILLMFTLAGQPAHARPLPEVTLGDLIQIDFAYTTISDNFYRNVPPQVLLDGARAGMLAYLRERGIARPKIEVMHARPDGRGAVPAIERELGRAIVRYGSRVAVHEFIGAVIRGELAALHDPYAEFFTPRELPGFVHALDGTAFGGIGAVLGGDGTREPWRIDSVFDDAPAARAGLLDGDTIVNVDGTPAQGLTRDALTALLRGKIGSVVRIVVSREGEVHAPIEIVRAVVTPPELTARMLPGNVGYIALHAFGANAGTEVHRALRRLEARDANAFVFDLRGDGGGYEHAALAVASAFIAHGPIVAVQENHGKRRVTSADGSAVAPHPLVVLVDHDSASGSELVTAALADRGVGKVVGTRTFGKGLVQSVFPMPDGSAMKLTSARYFTPNGRDIDRVGIAPDVVVNEPADADVGVPGHDPQLDAALELLKKDVGSQ